MPPLTLRSPGRALLVTNHLADLAGSEIVVAEIAQVLQERGWNVTLAAPWLGEPMTTVLNELGLNPTSVLSEVFPLEYDFSYVQHGLLPLTGLQDRGRDRGGLLVTGHLSPSNVMEQLGLALDEMLADRIWCNSEETCARMRELGLSADRLQDFRNAAPAAFRRAQSSGSRVLFVSNHPPPEVEEAADHIEAKGLVVERVGRRFGHVERVTPAMIARADRVVTIGKTVQYALLARRPVFIYDHFGGPGYLNVENFETARRFNFSGRSHPTRHDGPGLATLILEGFEAARRFALALPLAACRPFVLEIQLYALLACRPMPAAERRARITNNNVLMARERVQREAVLKFWLRALPKSRQADSLRRFAEPTSVSGHQGLPPEGLQMSPDRRLRLLETARARYVTALEELSGRRDWLPFPTIDDDYTVIDNPSEIYKGLVSGSLLIVHRSAQVDNISRITTSSPTDIVVIGPSASLQNTNIRLLSKGGLVLLHERIRIKNCAFLLTHRNCVLAIGPDTTWEGGGAQVGEYGNAIVVGAGCMLSSSVNLATTDHHPIFDRSTGERINQPSSVMVGDRSWLGRGVRVGKGVRIAADTIVEQGAVVNKPTEQFCLYAGVPAKLQLRDVTWRRSLKARLNDEEDVQK